MSQNVLVDKLVATRYITKDKKSTDQPMSIFGTNTKKKHPNIKQNKNEPFNAQTDKFKCRVIRPALTSLF